MDQSSIVRRVLDHYILVSGETVCVSDVTGIADIIGMTSRGKIRPSPLSFNKCID